MRWSRAGGGMVLVSFLLVLVSGVAAAHAVRSGETPREGARLDAPPLEVTIDFTEPPTSEFRLEVLDGCGRNVVDRAEVRDRTITASLTEGQPGEWSVSSSVISGIDGHQTSDGFSFAVSGRADCAQAAPGDVGDEGYGETNMTPFLIGGALMLVLVAGAFVARLRS